MDNAAKYDQYYTKVEVARSCVSLLATFIDFDDFDWIIEPSAGDGAFFNLLPITKRIGFDIDPKHPDIVKKNYFDFLPDLRQKHLVIGNPPFGKNANLAIKFFNKSAEYAHTIAFIVPRTFRKKSVINRLDKKFHLLTEMILPKDSFVYENKAYDVPCAFQIWKREATERTEIPIRTSHPDFSFGGKDDADFAIQRVGGRAGLIRDKAVLHKFAVQSHFFIKANDVNVLRIMQAIDFNAIKHDTAGNPSVSRSELIELYESTKGIIIAK
jgi:hypothetical protein